MRVLHTADWHLGRTLEGRSRLEEQTAFLDELVQIANERQIDLVLIAGDIYDSVNPPAAAEQLFYESVSRLSGGGKRSVLVIAGNHDNPDRISASAPLAGRQGIVLVGLPTAELQSVNVERTQEKANIFALPYPSESRLKELLSDSTEEEIVRAAYSRRVAYLLSQQARNFSADTVNIVMSHIYVLGGAESESERPIQVGGAYTVDASALCVNAQYVALGHLHRPQNIKAPALIRYSGSPLAYSFSEAGQTKSVTVLEMKPGQPPVMEEIYLRSGRPLVEWHAKEGIEQVHRWFDEQRDSSAWIDLRIHMNESLSMDQIQQLRKYHSGIINIRPVYPEMADDAVAVADRSLPVDELFRRFYMRQTGGAEPDPEMIMLFMELAGEQHENLAAAAAERKE